MKRVEANRYPHSAVLFKFCKEALELRYDGNVKVIDQDVGAILGYDPADCSHWKKGKKNIRSLTTLKSIADHLNVDERLLIDIAAGRVDLDEAIFEYKGYGAFAVQGKVLENLKKEYFKNPSKWQPEGSVPAFEEMFDTNRPAVVRLADHVMEAGGFTEAPIYVPEVFQLFPNIRLEECADLPEALQITAEGEEANLVTTIKYRGAEMRPYMRFIMIKELFKHLCRSRHQLTAAFLNSPEEILDIQANIFAGLVLVPGRMLRKEVERANSSFDIVMQLSEIFWISKSLMNQRLRDYLENFN
jgi:hypothetical protein